MDKNVKIGFIGCGNMGQALIKGLLKSKAVKPENIQICDKDTEKTKILAKKYKISENTAENIAQTSEIVIIAVKPNHIAAVLGDIAKDLRPTTLLISIAAGVTLAQLENMVGGSKKVIRVMPNTPAMVQEGASVLVRGTNVNDDDMAVALVVFGCVGLSLELGEDKIDAVTGLSGSSPAFVFQIIEAMGDAGVKAGLDRKTAVKLAAQTVLGAAKMVLGTGLHTGELKDMVTSPAGTTIEGVYEMEKCGVRAAIISTISVAVEKSKTMNKKQTV